MNVFYRLRNALIRFMYGRNGADQLSYAILAAELVLYLLSGLIRVQAVRSLAYFVSLALTVLLFYRMFSRNLTRRRAENERFLRWWNPVRARLLGSRARLTDRTHKYVKCSCGATCRVPRGVGTIEMVCPRCGEKKIVKT